MDILREWLARVVASVRRRTRDGDFDRELSSHLDMAIEDNLRRGLSAEEARRQALLRLGGMQQTRELHRETRGLRIVENVFQDLRYCLRTMRRDAGLAVFAIVVIGLGVGASSTVFNLVNALLVRPLPFDDPSRLVWIANGTSANLSAQTVQVADLQELRRQSRSLSAVAGFFPFHIGHGATHLTGAGEPERVTVVPVTEDFFPLLGVRPPIGRLFTRDECTAGRGVSGYKTALLSHLFWQRHFASDPAIVGRPIVLDGKPVTIVGVLPESLDFAGMFAPGSRVDLFVPFPLSPETDRMGNTLAVIGRLKPAVRIETAQAEATVIGERIEPVARTDTARRRTGLSPRLSPLRDRVSGTFRYALLLLAGAVGFVVLLVCVNLSNLLLARASSREREIATRVALGAGRKRLVQQMLTESLTLSFCGSVLGLMLAIAGTRLLSRLQGTTVPLLQQVRVDASTLGFALAAALLTGLVFGLMPAVRVSGLAPHGAMKAGGRGASGGVDRGWTGRSLVVSQVALACLLLTGAGLLMRSLIRVLDVDLGFHPSNVMAVQIDPGLSRKTLADAVVYFDEVLRRVREIPGVEAAGLTDALPLGQNFGWRTWGLEVKAEPEEPWGRGPGALVRIVDDGYFAAMKIALVAGRTFTSADREANEPVIVINEALARRLWPGEDPLGRLIRASGERRVVGVVRGVRYFGPEQDSGREIYLPIRQTRDGSFLVDLVVRSRRSRAELAPTLRAALRRVDPSLPAAEIRTMQALLDRAVFARRSFVLFAGGFAVFAVVLAALGIYGVIAYSVSRRRQEIGIRMALGASARGVQARVLMQTIRLAVVGMMLGGAGSWAVARALQSLLFGITFSDPTTYAGALALLAVAALAAGYLPARRAARVDPMEALRCE